MGIEAVAGFGFLKFESFFPAFPILWSLCSWFPGFQIQTSFSCVPTFLIGSISKMIGRQGM
jgi:hypothetical protein